MSNTSSITPYESRGNDNESISPADSVLGFGASACGGIIVGAAAVALAGTMLSAYGLYRLGRWLAVGREPSREELEQMKAVELEYREKMYAPDLSGMITLDLHQNNPESLVNSARQLNYRVITPPDHAMNDADAPILLERAAGERLAITRNQSGRLSIHTTHDHRVLHALVSRHTQDRVEHFLVSKGMEFKTARLSNGDMQILAREPAGGGAEIKTHVNSDGTTLVDIDKCRGPRCREIVDQLAEAAGCRVTGVVKKEAWYQLPGEPTKIRVKA